jgi:hypothetical protein
MTRLLKTPIRVTGTVVAAVTLAAAQGVVARPGTVNYTEGQVTLDGKAIQTKQLGSAELNPGQVLRTGNGKAEMLLTPGVFLRLGQNSAVEMVLPSLTDTEVRLTQGAALVEVAQVEKENHLIVLDDGMRITLEKKGLYDFNADQPRVAVYDGKAVVQDDDRSVELTKGKELMPQPAGAKLKPEKFNTKETDDLYAWSKLRSQYEAQANMASAQTVVVDNPAWWYGTGWYWNPWFSTWAFVPGAGFYYDPFGFGFYSPAYWYWNAPAYYYYPGRTWIGRGGFAGRRFGATLPPAVAGRRTGGFGSVAGSPRMAAPSFHAPAVGGGGVRGGGVGGRR